METVRRAFFSVFILGWSAQVLAAQGPAADPATASAPAMDALSDQEMLQIYGWMAGMRAGISRLGLTTVELEAFQQGVAAAAAGEDLEVDLQSVGPEISKFVQGKFDAHMAGLKAEQEAAAAAYWESLLGKNDVQQLESGLAYTIVRPGSELRPGPLDTVRAHYTGRLIDGTVFDTSEGGGPFETRLNQVIEGWTQGLPLIGEGGAIKLYIPADLGYGDEGTPSIPPGATLIFDVELVSVIPASPPEPAALSE